MQQERDVGGNEPAEGELPSSTGHLPADAVVIRGGLMKRGDLIASAEKYEALNPGVYGITVWSWPGLTAEQIAERVGTARLPHPDLRKSTVERICGSSTSEGQRFELTKTGPDGHYTLILPSPPTPDDWEALDEAFDAPQPNPVARR
jgi:hypothetical protein